MKKIQAVLLFNKIISTSKEAFDLQSNKEFGEREHDQVNYMPEEALYLYHKKQLEILDSKLINISQQNIIKKLQKSDKHFLTKYSIFQDLRNKGYIVKSGLKFGAPFRVYEKGRRTKEVHAKWLCFPISQLEKTKWTEFLAQNRVAHSTNKTMLLAITDQSSSISYYEINWKKIN